MKLWNWSVLGVYLFLASACGGRLAMVGFDKNGKPTEAFVNESRYAEKLKEALLTLDESVVPGLKPIQSRGDWKLRTAVVGFGVKAEAGIGPFKVAFKPSIHGAFGNGKNPPIP